MLTKFMIKYSLAEIDIFIQFSRCLYPSGNIYIRLAGFYEYDIKNYSKIKRNLSSSNT